VLLDSESSIFAQKVASITSDISQAAELLKRDELVAIPTETVYGLATNALSSKAVTQIFEVKDRPSFDPLIVHTHDIHAISDLILPLTEIEYELLRTYSPGPLTILLHKTAAIPDIVTAGLPKVGIRIPSHPIARRLLQSLDFPLAAPSANPFGYISPTSPSHVVDQLGDKISLILDGDISRVGVESTVLEVEEATIRVLRQGAITLEMLQTHGYEVVVDSHSSSNPMSPGMLKSHYAPRTPITVSTVPELMQGSSYTNIAALRFSEYSEHIPRSQQRVLSHESNLSEAAHNLFAALRELDQLGSDIISAEHVPDVGIGRAINDKLKRAAAT